MRSRLTIGIIGCLLLTLLTPTSLKAQQETAYGTSRQPQTCPSRSEPKTGPISAAQATQYAICDAEGDQVVRTPGKASFLEIFSLQVSPPREVIPADIVRYGRALDASRPIYEIKGRAIRYSCSQIAGSTKYAIAKRGENCYATGSTDSDSINSRGECYTDFAGRWRCHLSVGTTMRSIQGPPPNNAKVLGSSETQSEPNDSGESYRRRAGVKRINKDYQGALADLNRAIQINPNDAIAYVDRAGVKRMNKDYQGALADFKRAIQINPNNAIAYVDRGSLKFMALQDRAGAMKDWQQAAKLSRQQGDTTMYELVLDLMKESKTWRLPVKDR